MISVEPPTRTGRAAARPAVLLLGFVLLLAALLGGGYAAGSLVGPSGPGPAGPARPAVDEMPGMPMEGLRPPAEGGVQR
ncbi:hypothetical protein [Streptomyces sp. CB03911]|uniref:hypothetical protein n=1 Tax=Streptomycetaceae TaxID=2062 RepID=UPI0018FEC12A|nr:hypothetical protein [Streptomyces sp. CB03911]